MLTVFAEIFSGSHYQSNNAYTDGENFLTYKQKNNPVT